MADTTGKHWFSLTEVTPSETHDAPPLGERLSENMTALADKLAGPASSSWTTWTTGNPPDSKVDGGYEIDV
jgi:hypothetical protein